ncbi:cyclodeaminase [Amaricoccus tamworthensis]|uniref:cyclodeaminase n=1 Tax=Amaricoccus tamworthensis TaxID=57002 RepID=UPI003C7E0326
MTRDIRILTEAQLRGLVKLDLDLVNVIERAFAALDTGGVVMPPILSMDLPEVNGEVDVKTAYIPGFDGFAIKVSPGFFGNPGLGLPSLNGLMILFSARTGLVEAVFLDNGYLTDIRTAAAGAVAARHLAPAEVETAGVIGTGVQARLQMRAAHLVRPFRSILVHGRNIGKAEACARDLAETLNIEAEVVENGADLVARSQLVVTTTPSREPLIDASWLHEGLHVTAMGSDQAGKNEIDPNAIAGCDLYVADRLSQCETSGELEAVRAAGLDLRQLPTELGRIITGNHPGRTSDSAVTVADLTGTGAQDTAIASHVFPLIGSGGTVVST